LDDLAAIAGQSPFHFQREFKRRVGISPKRFGQYLTVNHAKQLLDSRASVLDAALDSGLSGPSRLHDLFVACEALTPGDYKAKGRSLTIRWGLHDVPVGRALIGATDRGICWLGFVADGDEVSTILEFKRDWGEATRVRDDEATRPLAEAAFAVDDASRVPLTLVLRGTNFQVKVWEALLRIPSGALATYGDLAGWIGQPTASRAVGAAVGANPISFLIPCHRVILNTGVIHNYRWGTSRKRALLAWEGALANQAA
jgi:AraC family transcriptional regulator of adaptative response/methylated-DNA-[protein]-cysteine methyltransferase